MATTVQGKGNGKPLASQSLVDAARPTTGRVRATGLDPRRRRISYFMLVRLVVLLSFTAIAGALVWQYDRKFGALYHGFVWGTLVVGYLLTIIYARLLPRVHDLERFAWIQTTTDIVLAAVVVQVSGGSDSGFVSLYLIAVLGAATMGGRGQTWAAAGACTLIYGTTSLLEGLAILEPTSLGQAIPPLATAELAFVVARTLAGLLGVTVLSSFLNTQLASSTTQLGDLRAMSENILRSLSSGIVGVDNDARVIYWNPAAGRILGLRDEDLQQPVRELLPGIEEFLALHPSAQEERERIELEIDARHGPRLHLLLSASRLRDGQGRRLGQLIDFQDVTRVHELAEQVRRSERLAAVGGLAASVAHEIRNPLAAISGSAELLSPEEPQEDDALLLSIIRRESARLSDLLTDMLAFTRPRAPQTVAISLARVARETLENFRADPANADLHTELRIEGMTEVKADPAQMSQVLWNLLRNAAEALEGRGRIDVEVFAETAVGEVQLTVKDDGPGVSSEQAEKIFDPFFTTKERGTGFGLATVHRIVVDNGGVIELDSSQSPGASFRLRFSALPPAKNRM